MIKKQEVQKYLELHFPDNCTTVFERFERYYEWLCEENQKINLISRKTDPEDIWILHFLDSILSVGCVDYRKKNIIDIGTGGGFPGVPLAILYPDAHVTLLDSTRKKIMAVKTGAAKAGVTNCSFLDIRLEDIPKRYFGTFDIVVSRSVRIIPDYKKLLLRMLKSNGRIVLYKGLNFEDTAIFPKISINDVSTPLIGTRKIIIIKKTDCLRQE